MSRGSFTSVARGLAWRNIHNWFTNPALIVPSILFPMFFFTAFAGGLSRVDSIPGFAYGANYTTWIYGFVLLQASTFGGIFTGFSVARDFESGFARRLLLASSNRSGVVLGYVVTSLLRWLVTVAVITAVAVAVRMKVSGGAVDLFGLYTLGAIVNLTATLWAAGVAMRLRTMQAAPIMQMPVFLILFFAPVYVPLSLLEGWIHAIAVANPVTPVLEAGRGFISGERTEVAEAFLLMFGLGVLFLVWAIRGLRKAEAAG